MKAESEALDFAAISIEKHEYNAKEWKSCDNCEYN